jgi:CHASE2 domain-containing sensor protein
VVQLFAAFTAAPTAIKLIVTVINGFIIGVFFGGLTEMKWLLGIVLVVMLLGPLRPWIGRHWALLLSTITGAVIGLFIGGYIAAQCGSSYAWLPLVGALIGAASTGNAGAEWLRHIEKDGKNGQSSRRH